MMVAKKKHLTQSRAKRPLKTKVTPAAPAAHELTPRSKRGVTEQMLDVQRTIWKTGVSVLSRGSKLTLAPVAADKITKSLQVGLKKLEDVFDQRVLDSLTRNSMPAPSEIRALMDRVAKLEVLVSHMRQRRGKRQ
jgi:hypothetical protein